MKLVPGGFRIWKFEFYFIKGPSQWSIDKSICQCLLVSMGRFGFTYLSSKYDCYRKTDK